MAFGARNSVGGETPEQFDVYANTDPKSSRSHPFLIVLQADLLAHLNTRIVAPLVAPVAMPPFERLVPVVRIEGAPHMVDVTNIGVVPVKSLMRLVTNLESERYRIVAAIDLVFTGV
jgi:toxin CcdB